MKFGQTLKEFIFSKVNIGSMLTIGSLTYFFVSGQITFIQWELGVAAPMVAMGLRDTMFKLSK